MKSTKQKLAKRPAAPPEAVPAVPVLPAPISATLSPQASELVRWYCGITKHREDATVEGAVFGIVARAKDAYEEGNFHDEAFNWLLEDALLQVLLRFEVQLAELGHGDPVRSGQRAANLTLEIRELTFGHRAVGRFETSTELLAFLLNTGIVGPVGRVPVKAFAHLLEGTFLRADLLRPILSRSHTILSICRTKQPDKAKFEGVADWS